MRYDILAAVLAVAALGGCASVVRGTTEQVQFDSNPPCTAQVARNEALIVTFSKEGYEEQTVPLRTKVSGGGVAGVAGNVLLGGAVGLVVDAGTGAGMDHYPNPLVAVLTPVKKPEAPPVLKQKRNLKTKTSAISH